MRKQLAKQNENVSSHTENAVSQMVASVLTKMIDTLLTLTALVASRRDAQEENSTRILWAVQTIAQKMRQAKVQSWKSILFSPEKQAPSKESTEKRLPS